MISLYNNVYQTESQNTIEIKDYFNNIQNGFWQDFVLNWRAGKSKKEFIPAVTPSGFFPTQRKKEKLKNHSGYICLDYDFKENPDILNKRDEIYSCKYLVCGHISVSGNGLALFFKIDKRQHEGSFLALEKYLANKYHIISDPSCKDVSRLRFVSYDPELYYNPKAIKWYETINKKTIQPKNFNPIFDNNDIDFILSQINQTGIDLTHNYRDWLALGFAFVSEFGEIGRDYFHKVSYNHPKYDYKKTNKKYDNLLKSGSRKFTINTFFWLAKQNGLKIKTEKTERIQRVATIRKKQIGKPGGAKDIIAAKENTFQYLNDFEDIKREDATKIVNSVMESNVDEHIETSDIEMIIEYVKSQKLKYNVITQKIEIDNEDLTDRKENSLFINIKELFPKARISKDLINSIIHSDRTPEYNPFLEFIEKNKHLRPKGNVEKLLDCFILKNINLDYIQFCGILIEKWLLSLIGSIHGTYSLLILVLIGKQMTNKTNFFRFLLPDELEKYYAESKLDRDKDDELLMSQKLILVDDEFAGKSKKEAGKLKELSSKQVITARKSYGRYNEDFKRLAVLGGTSNETDVINDTTGNRRILPILIEHIDLEKFKKINKTDLFIELYHKWRKLGNEYWFLSREEVERLNEFSQNFTEISLEEDLIRTYFEIPDGDYKGNFYTATEMITYCESFLSKQKLYHKTFGKVLKKLKFKRVQKHGRGYGYLAIKKIIINYES